MTELAFTPQFAEWAAAAGYTVFAEDDGISVADAGGEIRYSVASDGSTFSLERAERAEDPEVLLRASDLRFIEVAIVQRIAGTLRASRGLGRIALPFAWDDAAPGYVAVRLDDGWTGLERDGARLPLAVRDRDHIHPVVALSYVIDQDPATVMDSYAAPDGAPLLTPYVVPA